MNKFLFPKSLLFCSFENFYVALEMIIRKRKECKGGHCVFIERMNVMEKIFVLKVGCMTKILLLKVGCMTNIFINKSLQLIEFIS